MEELKPSKIAYYLDIAETVGKKATCLRTHYGAIIVKNDEIIATGYNGAPRNCGNCKDIGSCPREIMGVHHGDAYNLCCSVHAEMNAMLSAARRDMIGAYMFIVGRRDADHTYADPSPCLLCHRMIVNSGIVAVYGRYGTEHGGHEDKVIDASGKTFMRRVRKEFDKTMTSLPYEQVSALIETLDKYPVN